MGEQEIVPGLLHNPGAGGQTPGAMGHVWKQIVHGSSLAGECSCTKPFSRVGTQAQCIRTKWPLRIHKHGG
jgi:hypothetical protein